MTKLIVEKVDDELMSLTLPKEVRDLKLGETARSDKSLKKMLAFILKMCYTMEAQSNGYCYISDSDMSAACGMTKSNIRLYAQKLKEAGLLVDFKVGNRRGQGIPPLATCYYVANDLVPKINSLGTENCVEYHNTTELNTNKNNEIEDDVDDTLPSSTQTNSHAVSSVLVSDYIDLVNRIDQEQEQMRQQVEELKGQLQQVNNTINKDRENNKQRFEYLKKHLTIPSTCDSNGLNVAVNHDKQTRPEEEIYQQMSSLIEQIKQAGDFSIKVNAAKELNNLMGSANLNEKQMETCQKWVSPYSKYFDKIENKQPSRKKYALDFFQGCMRGEIEKIRGALRDTSKPFDVDLEIFKNNQRHRLRESKEYYPSSPEKDKCIEDTLNQMVEIIISHNRQFKREVQEEPDECDDEPF